MVVVIESSTYHCNGVHRKVWLYGDKDSMIRNKIQSL